MDNNFPWSVSLSTIEMTSTCLKLKVLVCTLSGAHCYRNWKLMDASRSFVFGQLRAKVSAGFTNVSNLTVAAFDLVYCSLSVIQFFFVLDISKWSS